MTLVSIEPREGQRRGAFGLARPREALLGLPFVRDFREMRRKALHADRMQAEFSRAVEVGDDNFRRLYPHIVQEAHDAPAETGLPAGRTWTKTATYTVRPSSGLTAYQSFILELACLSRLARHDSGAHRRFPAIAAIDWEARSFRTSDVGTALHLLDQPTRVRDLDAQIAEIVSGLERAGVLHLDLNPRGLPRPELALKNIAVDRHGNLALIDFDIASIDDECISPFVRNRWRAFHDRGGLPTLTREIRDLVRTHPCIEVTG